MESLSSGGRISTKERKFNAGKESEKMSVYLVETYVVKAEKQAKFTPLLNEFLKYKEKHHQLFKGLKSWKLYKQDYGAISGLYIEMWEYESLGDLEKINTRIFKDRGMKKIAANFHPLVDPATFSANIWSPVA